MAAAAQWHVPATHDAAMDERVASIMQTRVVSLSVRARLPEIERLLIESQVGGCPVVGDDGIVCGVLTRSDIVRQLCTEHALAASISDYYTDPAGFGIRLPDADSFEDIAMRVGLRMDQLRATDVMSREVVSVGSSTSVRAVARLMVERALHRLPVIDEGRLVGVVSTLDILRLVADGDAV